MFKNTLLLIVLLVSTFMKSEGKPVIEIESREANPTVTMGSRIAPSVGEWINFHRAWSFPSLTSVTSLFSDESDENDASTLNNRIDSLERTQKEIINMIKKLSQDISALSGNYRPSVPNPTVPVNNDNNNKETSTESQTVPSTTNETNNEKNEEDQKPKPADNPEVTKKPVDIEQPATQENTKPTVATNDNEEKNPGENVAEIIPETTENNPEVPTAEKKNA